MNQKEFIKSRLSTYSKIEMGTYSWISLVSKIGVPLLTSILGSAASKAKFELTKDKDVFDETLRKFKKAKNADDVKKYYDMLQSQLNKAQNKDEVKDDLKEAKKEAETKAYSKTKTYSNEFKSIEDGRIGIFKNAVLKNKDGGDLLEVDLGNGFTAQVWWEPEFFDFDWQLNDNNKQDSDSFETLYELETEIKNRGLATYSESIDPIKSELISYLETSIQYDKDTLEEIKGAIKSADKSELIGMLDEEIANNDTPKDIEKFKSIRTKLSTNSKRQELTMTALDSYKRGLAKWFEYFTNGKVTEESAYKKLEPMKGRQLWNLLRATYHNIRGDKSEFDKFKEYTKNGEDKLYKVLEMDKHYLNEVQAVQDFEEITGMKDNGISRSPHYQGTRTYSKSPDQWRVTASELIGILADYKLSHFDAKPIDNGNGLEIECMDSKGNWIDICDSNELGDRINKVIPNVKDWTLECPDFRIGSNNKVILKVID